MELNELERQYFSEDNAAAPLRLKLLLLQFINQTDQRPICENKIRFFLKDLLEFLVSPDGNNNHNCKIIDWVLTDRYLNSLETLQISADLKNIIEDMLWNLHDTHTSPEIAKEFHATPHQLLERLGKLEKTCSGE